MYPANEQVSAGCLAAFRFPVSRAPAGCENRMMVSRFYDSNTSNFYSYTVTSQGSQAREVIILSKEVARAEGSLDSVTCSVPLF